MNKLSNIFLDMYYNIKFRNSISKKDILYIDPKSINKYIEFEQVKKRYFGKIMKGDWDLHVKEINGVKTRSMEQHFNKGVPWLYTELFDVYKFRLKEERFVKGCATLSDLNMKYEKEIDSLYNNIKNNGFLLPSDKNPNIEIISVYISRDGEFLLGSSGNHRIGMAKVLGLNKIPVFVRARHLEWQIKREEIIKPNSLNIDYSRDDYTDHPDLRDRYK